VSADRLADVVWGDAPPEAVAAALAKDVYRLRARSARWVLLGCW
jgi:hypothetical protein